MTDIVAVDTSHLLYRVFNEVVGGHSTLSRKQTQLAEQQVIKHLRKYKNQMKPDVFITAFDDKHSWRTQYSVKNRMPAYKISRTKYATLKERRKQESFNKFRDQMQGKLNKMKGVVVMKGGGLEADDLLAGLARVKKPSDKLNIITLDQDNAFLMKTKGVDVYDMRTIRKMDATKLEEKRLARILGGRHAYNVHSVFNRLSHQRYLDVMNGDVTLDELFASETPNQQSRMSARKRFQHNETLLDVSKPPKEVERRVVDTIRKSFKR